MRMPRRKFLGLLASTTAATSLRRAHAQSPSASTIADDPLRPACHFLAPHNWMNDPNGPIFWKGNYHLFYQLNPHGADWGMMHWGHAISTDMIHWRHEPIAVAPTPGGPDSEGCFSGSAVVFRGVPTVLYTGVQSAPRDQATIRDGNDKLRETQLLATADDDQLLHWTKRAEPVLASPPPGIRVTGFRDPCPWQEADGWYLAIGSGERGRGGCILLYRSQDLRHWDYLHPMCWGKPNGLVAANPCDSGEMWECPDFFTLNGHHCLLYSTENKVFWTTGDYDPHTHLYTPRRTGLVDHGAFYAPKSFLAPDGRRIQWGWIKETRPEAEYAAAGWAGCMSLPRELTVGAQGQLEMRPAAEVARLRGTRESAKVSAANPFRRKLNELRHEVHIPIDFSVHTVTVRLMVDNNQAWQLEVNVPANSVHGAGVTFPLPAFPWPRPDLHIFLDGSVIETFIGGREAITSRVYTVKPGATELIVETSGPKSIDVQSWPLRAISPDRLTA